MQIIEQPPINPNTPRPLSRKNAALFWEKYQVEPCKSCKTDLNFRTIIHYEHRNGWHIPGFQTHQWVYIECPKCGNQWSLIKLGVKPRKVE